MLEENSSSSRAKKKNELPVLTLSDLDTTPLVPINEVGFDLATGGGVPLETLIEIFGPSMGGKTTLAFEMAKAFLRKFPTKYVDYYNYERSIDKFYVRNLIGNDEDLLSRFRIIQPEYFEDGAERIVETMELNSVSFVIVDSLAAMTPKQEDEADLDNNQVAGFKGKLMAKLCRKIGNRLPGSQQTIAFINHENVLLGGFSFIKQTTTPGGDSLKFWASMRLQLKALQKLTREETVIGQAKKDKIAFGNAVQISVVKNKFHPPFKKCISYVMYGKGLDRARTLIDFGVQLGLIGKKGKTDYFLVGKEENTIKGIQNLADTINEKPKVQEFLEFKIKEKIDELKDSKENKNLEEFQEDVDDI